ncbi:MAG: hypothetical protein JJ905_09950 [Psychroserpens sp.]|uniref:hypothetical protein n=1 Tax=Psychroserpens sp. TaxID=2020870 RepID=UPI001B038B3E|nr:hypothetical protein [Psychroserpens sp.]MBO6632472.1 hypothetical protein [Psychroserpens sp.]MBO6653462.1 hypothetical protein [Psychroserpens sp.]MBO6750531.1 hypothetical protein [Psychroserpens sp.]MBO6942174.1 hypothetical protein [Psychroserpens sp.]
MKQLYLFILFCFSLSSQAQTLKGYVYDSEATVKGARLVNTTKNTLNYTNDKGYFNIKAESNDTLVVFSYFHLEQTIIITPDMFDKDIVIELKKVTNLLDEVELANTPQKKFDSSAVQSVTAKQGQIAFKERVFASGDNYRPTLNVIALVGAIGKLFKRKNKKPEIRYVEADDLEKLFKNSSFFTQRLLLNDLAIPEDYQYLFFEYCSAQTINYNLIAAKKEIELLDLLNGYSKEFHKLLEEYQED